MLLLLALIFVVILTAVDVQGDCGLILCWCRRPYCCCRRLCCAGVPNPVNILLVMLFPPIIASLQLASSDVSVVLYWCQSFCLCTGILSLSTSLEFQLWRPYCLYPFFYWCFYRFWHPCCCRQPLLFYRSCLLCCCRACCWCVLTDVVSFMNSPALLPSLLLLMCLLQLVFTTFLVGSQLLLASLLFLTSLLLLPRCCCWLPCCCYASVPAVGGNPVVAVALLLLSFKKSNIFDYRNTTIGQVIFSAIGLSIIGPLTQRKKYRTIDYRNKVTIRKYMLWCNW